MSSHKAPEFTDSERWVLASTLKERYGTGKVEYDNRGDCITSLLRVQADHGATGEGRAAPRCIELI